MVWRMNRDQFKYLILHLGARNCCLLIESVSSSRLGFIETDFGLVLAAIAGAGSLLLIALRFVPEAKS
jgi:hypothetical protein